MTPRNLSISLLGLGLTLLSMASVPFVFAQDATSEATQAAAPLSTEASEAAAEATASAFNISQVYDLSQPAVEPTGDNSYCAICHDAAWRSVTLGDGHILSLFAPADAVAKSVHGSGETPLGCVDCHGQDSFPHSGPRPAAYRPHAINSNQMCVGCHSEHATDAAQGLHVQAILAGNAEAAVCTDCHGAHDVQPVKRQPQLLADTCATCHTDTYSQWRSSAHVDIGPLGCTSCHGKHTQELRIEQTDSNSLCLNCHKQMPDQWIHASHNAYEPAIECVACHMDAQHVEGSAQRVAFTGAGLNHSMTVSTATCTTCHEQANISVADTSGTSPQEAALPEAREATPTDSGFVQLIQGLILGLGLGATAAIVFVARGNQR